LLAAVWLNAAYCCGSLSRSGRSALYSLIVPGFARLDTLLIIQHPHAFLGRELLMLFLLFQHVQYALTGFNFIRIALCGINAGAVGIF
jgi:hypothetical protein